MYRPTTPFGEGPRDSVALKTEVEVGEGGGVGRDIGREGGKAGAETDS